MITKSEKLEKTNINIETIYKFYLSLKSTIISEIDNVFDYISKTELTVICGRYINKPKKTQREISKTLNLSSTRIGQIEYKLYRKVCHPSRTQRLSMLFDMLFYVLQKNNLGLLNINDIEQFVNSKDYFAKIMIIDKVKSDNKHLNILL